MKQMKVCCWLLCVILIMTASFAMGEEITVYLSDIDMTISFPEGSIVLTRNMSDTDPNLKYFGMTAKEIRDILIAHDRDAEVRDLQMQDVAIFVNGKKTEEYSFATWPDYYFDEMLKRVKFLFESDGQKVLYQAVEEINGIKYIVTERYLGDFYDTYAL